MNQLVLIVPIASALLIYWARIRELKTIRDTVKGEVRENLTLRLFIAVGSLMLLGSIGEQLWFRRPLSVALLLAGWAVALSSFWLRRRAIRELGKMWSLHVEIRAQHQLIMSGPYRWVRHPAYTSMVLELASFGLLLQSFYTSALVALLFIPTLVLRIKIEEAALREQVAGYSEYQRSTPALLPYKLPGAVQS
ncbi:MAG: isoprenylcysteine carboxylmethyltransferase family protein [Pseudomonadota bacterium]